MQRLDDGSETRAVRRELTRAGGGPRAEREVGNFVVVVERHELGLLAESSLERAFQDGTHEHLRARRQSVHTEHESAAPALDAQITEPEERQLTPQMFGPDFDRRAERVIAESGLNATTNLRTQTVTEITSAGGSCALAESENERRRQVEPCSAFVVTELAPSQVENDGAGWIEAWGHGQFRDERMCQYRVVVRSSVKSRAERGARRLASAALLGATCGAFTLHVARADAEREVVPPLLLGGASAQARRDIPLDPLLPRGEIRPRTQQEPLDADTLCSARRPVCVVGTSADRTRALTLLEVAHEEQRFGAGLPVHAPGEAPLVWRFGQSAPPSLSTELVGPSVTPLDDLEITLEERLDFTFDRARATCHGGRLDARDATRCVAEASLAALAPATARTLRRGYGVFAAAELHGSFAEDRSLYQIAQLSPRFGIATRVSAGAADARSALFFHYVSDSSQERSALAAPFALLTLAATRTNPAALRFDAEPDAFDVLRASLNERRDRFAALFDDFAVARLGLGKAHGFLGIDDASLAPRFAWDIEERSLPRQLVLSEPFEPTGSVYVRVRSDTPLHDPIAVRIGCEKPVSYVWSIVGFDHGGRELSHVRVAFQERGSDFDQHVIPRDGTTSFVVVGTNLGGIDLDHPFDPDHAPLEAHACSVYLTKL